MEEVSGFVVPEKRSPAITAGRAMQFNYCIFITVLALYLALARLQASLTSPFSPDMAILCMWTIDFHISCSRHFCRCSCKGNTSGIFLISTAHASVKRGYLFSEPGGNGTASIVGFGPVKRDAEKCTTGTTRHAWIQIAHNSPVQL